MQKPLGFLRIIWVLVAFLQLFGLFPYRWQKDSHLKWRLDFSASLFSWSVCTNLISLFGCLGLTMLMQDLPETSIGELIYKNSLLAANYGYSFIGICLLYKSPKLKILLLQLSDLFTEVGVSRSSTRPPNPLRLVNKKWIGYWCLMIQSFIGYINQFVMEMTMPLPAKLLTILANIFLFGTSITVFCLFDGLLTILGAHLRETTQRVTQHVPKVALKGHDHPAWEDHHQPGKMMQLQILEQQVRKVRRKVALYNLQY